MKNSIRCCISCILPCGALDVIRIVHANGRVEEIAGTVTASQIMTAYPKHVLKKPSSSAADDGIPRIVVVPPDAELQRGKIYFLIPVPSAAAASAKAKSKSKKQNRRETDTRNDSDKEGHDLSRRSRSRSSSCARKGDAAAAAASVVVSDQYLSEIMSETVSTQRERRRGRVAVWRPHLESITEAPNDA